MTGLLIAGSLVQARYRIEALIGQGGFGAVYAAVDERLDRRVALKQLLRTGDRLSRQFEREARLLANLHHPTLPRVTDYFTTDDGQFLVMDFVSGADLGTLLHSRDVPFPVEQVLGWAFGLLDALQYLHMRVPPIIHRDIKPQNLKLQADGTIMLLDFGLAKGSIGASSPSTTERSLLAYTRGFAPPEQVEGTGTDARSDLYALGATLHCLLTNVPPPEAHWRMLAAARQRDDPLRPANALNAAVSEPISRVLQQAVALEPDERPHSAVAMRELLKATRDAGVPTLTTLLPTAASEPTIVQIEPAVLDSEPTVLDSPPSAAAPRSPLPDAGSELADQLASGDAALASGKLDEAITAYGAAVDLNPTVGDVSTKLDDVQRRQTLSGLYTEARTMHRRGKWQAVIDTFGQIATIDAQYPDPDGLLASATAALVEAEQHEARARSINHGRQALEQGALEEAQRLFEAVARQDPKDADAAVLLKRVQQLIDARVAAPSTPSATETEGNNVSPGPAAPTPAEPTETHARAQQVWHGVKVSPAVIRPAPAGAAHTARTVAAPRARFPLVPAIVGIILSAVLIGGAVFLLRRFDARLTGDVDDTAPGQAIELMPTRNHVQTASYNSNPPTSGDHMPEPALSGFYRTTPPPDEQLVHSLEHGNVVMYWDPSKLDAAQFTHLKALYDDLHSQRACIILAQRTMDKPIALTSWGYLAWLDGFDEGAIRAFWRDHVAHGPELESGQCQ